MTAEASTTISDHTATFHAIDTLGITTDTVINHLPGTSIEAAWLGYQSSQVSNDQLTIVWADFQLPHQDKRWFESQLATTYLATSEIAAASTDFMSAGTIISSVLHASSGTANRHLSHAHEKTMENFAPLEDYQPAVRFIKSWLPKFCKYDQPHPPRPAVRTDTIRFLNAVIHTQAYQAFL